MPMGSAMLRLGTHIVRWVVIVQLVGCGNPNVPLTQPPADAFRVASPRPPSPRPTPRPLSIPLGSLTARFFNLPWLGSPPRSLLRLSAEFLGIPLPAVPAPQASPPLRPQNTPQ